LALPALKKDKWGDGGVDYLKSGMPLGVLIPAPAITTTRRHCCFRMSSATSCRVSCCFPPSPPHLPAPRTALAAADRERGLAPWILLGTEREQRAAHRQRPRLGAAQRALRAAGLRAAAERGESLTVSPTPGAGTFRRRSNTTSSLVPLREGAFGQEEATGTAARGLASLLRSG